MMFLKISQNSDFKKVSLFKNRFCDKCFLVNFVKLLRTSFLTEPLWWLLMSITTLILEILLRATQHEDFYNVIILL